MNGRPWTLVALVLASCSATSNPKRSDLAPVTRVPEAAPADPAPGAPAVGAQANASAEPAPSAPVAAQPVAGKPELSLGRVGDLGIDPRDFLRKMWIDDNALARRLLEQLVFAKLATLESDRLGILLLEGAVEMASAQAISTLEKKLVERGSKLTLDEHIERNLELDPGLYRANLREEAIAQMLAERCVRAWMYESERRDVRLTEIRERAALDAAVAEIDAQTGFDAIAAAHGFGEDESTHATKMTVARAESQDLARLVFATPVGSIGGPLEQNGRWLLFVVDAEHRAQSGGWRALRGPVEQSLLEEPVSNLEFLQWRAAMVRRYQVDLEPFFEIVERRTP